MVARANTKNGKKQLLSQQSVTPLFVRGSYNAEAQTLTFAVINRAVGRICGLDLGKDHHNPDCQSPPPRQKELF